MIPNTGLKTKGQNQDLKKIFFKNYCYVLSAVLVSMGCKRNMRHDS